MHSCIRLRITRVVIEVKVSPVNRLGPCCHEVDLAGGRCDSTPGLVCVVSDVLPGVRGVSGGPARGERSHSAVAPLSLPEVRVAAGAHVLPTPAQPFHAQADERRAESGRLAPYGHNFR